MNTHFFNVSFVVVVVGFCFAVPPERIWKDPEVLTLRTSPRAREMQIDASGRKFRLATASHMLSAMEDARHTAIPGFTIPYCLIHGTHDDGVKIDGSEYMWKTAATPESDRAFKRVQDGYHCLFAEKEAEEHFAFAMEWMNKMLAKK
jgi:alpha-beta hydrolase superfamily lysophospholipase